MQAASCPDLRRLQRRQRRRLLQLGGLGMLGMSLPTWLDRPQQQASAASVPRTFGQAKACIFLFMWGGPAQHDTWDLKPHAPAEIRGEFQPIATAVPGIQICEHFPQLARRTDRLSIIRSMTHGDVNHTSATHFLLTGQPPPGNTEVRAQWPHIGSVLAHLGRGSGPLPPFISMRPKLENTVPRFVEQSQGQFAGWLGPVDDPFTIDHAPDRADYQVGDLTLPADIPQQRLSERRRLLADLNDRLADGNAAFDAKAANEQRAFDLLTSSISGSGAFDLTQESTRMRERYGLNPHGQSVLQARRLVERGVPLITVFWPNDGIKNVSVYWDTHSRNFIDHKTRLMPAADQAFSALLDDLQDRGMLDDTLVVWSGEFGRTPKVGQRNSDAGAGRDGRDHWPNCFTTVLAGGGVRGGYVHGRSDRQAAYPAESPVAPADLVASLYHLLGVPHDLMLHDTGGRPHRVRPGAAIRDLFA